MLDPELQQRFARSCTEAAFGYSAAGTAAYAAFTDQVLNFWKSVLQQPAAQPAPVPQPAAWPMPFTPEALAAMLQANPFVWALPKAPAPAVAPKLAATPQLPTNPWEAMAQFAEVMSNTLTAMAGTQVKPAVTPANPMAAWLTPFPLSQPAAAWPMPFPFAQPHMGWPNSVWPTSAWPMAFMMMSQGVPHAVAWPTAEANAAVLDAADVARRSIRKTFASYQTDGGHAAGGGVWPPANLLTLFAMVPLNIGTMLTAMRLH